MRIINPRNDQTVHIGDVSKTQLARVVNEQSQQIRTLDRNIKTLGKLLIALTLEPESLQYADGAVTIEAAACAKVKAGMQLSIEANDLIVSLRVITPDVQQVEIPKIVVPGGLH